MKNVIKFFALAVVILGFSANSFGQVGTTATADASATIVTPIAVTKNVDLVFGNIAVNASVGTVQLAASEAATRTPGGGVTLPVVSGTFTAAKFTVTGVSGSAYTFSVPAGATTVDDNNAHTMTIDSWTSNSTSVITGGSIEVYVGATLNVGASQAPGVYTSDTPFTVTVNYN